MGGAVANTKLLQVQLWCICSLSSPPAFCLTPSDVASVWRTSHALEFHFAPSTLPHPVHTGVFETISAQLILVSIGYKSLPVPGLPFDSRKGIVPNEAGRVLSPTAPAAPSATGEHCGAGNKYEPGLYVCGWLKRGPTGIVGTNLVDAGETVQCLAEDDAAGKLPGRRAEAGRKAGESEAEADLEGLLKGRGVRVVTFEEWLKLDSEEQRRGGQQGRVRSKIASVPEMLRLL